MDITAWIILVLGLALLASAIRYGTVRLAYDELADVNEALAKENIRLRGENVALRLDVNTTRRQLRTIRAHDRMSAELDAELDQALAIVDKGLDELSEDPPPASLDMQHERWVEQSGQIIDLATRRKDKWV